MASLNVLLGVAVFAVLTGASTLSFQLAKNPPAERPILGARGLNRARYLSRSMVFAFLEPTVRVLTAWVSLVPLGRVRRRMRLSLIHAGEYMGLSEDELIAASALFGAGLGFSVWLLCDLLGEPRSLSVCAALFGAAAPWFRVHSVAQTRARSVNRALPSAVELAAMCMSGGLDFPGALRQIVESATDPSEPLIEEFNHVLQELDLGHTRRSAMAGFASRIPTEQVREFVNSVIQAEDKGSPLTNVLSIQSQTQRLRRSIAAEETASEAALMLLGPMTLIFLCVIVLLLGPVVVRFMTGGLGPA